MLAEAHAALGTAYARTPTGRNLRRVFGAAIELDPNRSETLGDFAMFLLWPLDRTEEALKELRLAEKADPLSSGIHLSLCYALPSAGRYDEASSEGEKILTDSPGRSAYVGRARFLQGRTAEAIQILEAAFQQGVTPGSEVRAFLGYAFVRGPVAASRLRKWQSVQIRSIKL